MKDKKKNNVRSSNRLVIYLVTRYALVLFIFLSLMNSGRINYLDLFKDNFFASAFIFLILMATLSAVNTSLFNLLRKKNKSTFNKLVFVDIGEFLAPLYRINEWFNYIWTTKQTDRTINRLIITLRIIQILIIATLIFYFWSPL